MGVLPARPARPSRGAAARVRRRPQRRPRRADRGVRGRPAGPRGVRRAHRARRCRRGRSASCRRWSPTWCRTGRCCLDRPGCRWRPRRRSSRGGPRTSGARTDATRWHGLRRLGAAHVGDLGRDGVRGAEHLLPVAADRERLRAHELLPSGRQQDEIGRLRGQAAGAQAGQGDRRPGRRSSPGRDPRLGGAAHPPLRGTAGRTARWSCSPTRSSTPRPAAAPSSAWSR